MFKNMLRDIFSRHSSLGDRMKKLLLLLLTLAAAGMLLMLIYMTIDPMGLEDTNTTTTTIEQKNMLPAHTTTTVILVGKVPMTQVIPHPEAYRLNFKINGTSVSIPVSKPYFDSVENGQEIEVDYGYSRLTGSYQPTAIRSK